MKLTAKFSFIISLLLMSAIISCTQKNNAGADPVLIDTLKEFAANQYAFTDQSPMDVSYYPNEYPQQKMSNPSLQEKPVARILYSRPHKKGRTIFSDDEKSLCPYGKPWRLGANEATEIEFFKPVVIDGKNISAGRYILYCIPYKDKWIIAVNSNLYSWGLQIDRSKDLLVTEIPVQKQSPAIEDFTIAFQSANYGADLIMKWDDVKAILPITFSK